MSHLTTKLSLREALAVLTYEKELNFATHKTLAEWLGCYIYVMPAQRVLSEEAYDLPIKHTPHSILYLYNYITSTLQNYNIYEQQTIVRYLKCQTHQAQEIMASSFATLASKISPTHRF